MDGKHLTVYLSWYECFLHGTLQGIFVLPFCISSKSLVPFQGAAQVSWDESQACDCNWWGHRWIKSRELGMLVGRCIKERNFFPKHAVDPAGLCDFVPDQQGGAGAGSEEVYSSLLGPSRLTSWRHVLSCASTERAGSTQLTHPFILWTWLGMKNISGPKWCRCKISKSRPDVKKDIKSGKTKEEELCRIF